MSVVSPLVSHENQNIAFEELLDTMIYQLITPEEVFPPPWETKLDYIESFDWEYCFKKTSCCHSTLFQWFCIYWTSMITFLPCLQDLPVMLRILKPLCFKGYPSESFYIAQVRTLGRVIPCWSAVCSNTCHACSFLIICSKFCYIQHYCTLTTETSHL